MDGGLLLVLLLAVVGRPASVGTLACVQYDAVEVWRRGRGASERASTAPALTARKKKKIDRNRSQAAGPRPFCTSPLLLQLSVAGQGTCAL